MIDTACPSLAGFRAGWDGRGGQRSVLQDCWTGMASSSQICMPGGCPATNTAVSPPRPQPPGRRQQACSCSALESCLDGLAMSSQSGWCPLHRGCRRDTGLKFVGRQHRASGLPHLCPPYSGPPSINVSLFLNILMGMHGRSPLS